MKTAALIVTTGLSSVSGVTALLSPVDAISAGQRMICVFRCADVSLVGLAVGPEKVQHNRMELTRMEGFGLSWVLFFIESCTLCIYNKGKGGIANGNEIRRLHG